jgi:hypothetical protein
MTAYVVRLVCGNSLVITAQSVVITSGLLAFPIC